MCVCVCEANSSASLVAVTARGTACVPVPPLTHMHAPTGRGVSQKQTTARTHAFATMATVTARRVVSAAASCSSSVTALMPPAQHVRQSASPLHALTIRAFRGSTVTTNKGVNASTTSTIPADAAFGYAVTGVGVGVAAVTHTSTGFDIATDVPRRYGGGDAAPQPVEALLAALIGCETTTAVYVARHMKPRFPLLGITFDYKASRDSRGAMALPLDEAPPAPAWLQRVEGTAVVHLKPRKSSSHADSDVTGMQEQAARVEELHRHVERRCPVASMLVAAGCDMRVTWRLATTDDAPPPEVVVARG